MYLFKIISWFVVFKEFLLLLGIVYCLLMFLQTSEAFQNICTFSNEDSFTHKLSIY